MKNISISPILGILIVLIIAGGTFFGGMQYQKSQSPSGSGQSTQGNRNGQFQGRGTGNRNGLRPVTGEIISSDDKSLTVKLADGSTKIVILSQTTNINKADKATVADLKTGQRVAVFGMQNPDGSVTAQNIQLNPIMRNFQGTQTGSTQQNQ